METNSKRTMTLNLPGDEFLALERVASERKATKTAVVREALSKLFRAQKAEKQYWIITSELDSTYGSSRRTEVLDMSPADAILVWRQSNEPRRVLLSAVRISEAEYLKVEPY